MIFLFRYDWWLAVSVLWLLPGLFGWVDVLLGLVDPQDHVQEKDGEKTHTRLYSQRWKSPYLKITNGNIKFWKINTHQKLFFIFVSWTGCCEFKPANACSAVHSLVGINFLVIPSFLSHVRKKLEKIVEQQKKTNFQC